MIPRLRNGTAMAGFCYKPIQWIEKKEILEMAGINA
jgi:hypothetical protein